MIEIWTEVGGGVCLRSGPAPQHQHPSAQIDTIGETEFKNMWNRLCLDEEQQPSGSQSSHHSYFHVRPEETNGGGGGQHVDRQATEYDTVTGKLWSNTQLYFYLISSTTAWLGRS